MKLRDKNILIISNEPWGEIWYSKHHWAYSLSINNNVYFVNSPQRWSLNNFFRTNIRTKNHSKSLHIINYNNPLPFSRFSVLFKLNEYIVSIALKKWFKERDFNDFLFWSFDPFRFSSPKLLNPKASIYHITDLFHNKRENKIIKNVDYILSVNDTLLERFSIYRGKSLVIPHGILETHKPSTELKNQIILIGTFTDRVNLKLLEKLSKAFPKTNIVLYGPDFFKDKCNSDLFQKLIAKNNVSYLGYGSLKNIEEELKASKLAIATYIQDNLGNRLNSLKIIQYLSYGKNIVSSYFDDYKNASEEGLIEMTNNDDEFIEKCRALLNKKENHEIIEKRIAFSKKFLYSNLINIAEQFLI